MVKPVVPFPSPGSPPGTSGTAVISPGSSGYGAGGAPGGAGGSSAGTGSIYHGGGSGSSIMGSSLTGVVFEELSRVPEAAWNRRNPLFGPIAKKDEPSAAPETESDLAGTW